MLIVGVIVRLSLLIVHPFLLIVVAGGVIVHPFLLFDLDDIVIVVVIVISPVGVVYLFLLIVGHKIDHIALVNSNKMIIFQLICEKNVRMNEIMMMII